MMSWYWSSHYLPFSFERVKAVVPIKVATIPKFATTYVESKAVTISTRVSGMAGDITNTIKMIDDTDDTQQSIRC